MDASCDCTKRVSIETYLQSLPHGITLSCRASGERGRPVLLFLNAFPAGEAFSFAAVPRVFGVRAKIRRACGSWGATQGVAAKLVSDPNNSLR